MCANIPNTRPGGFPARILSPTVNSSDGGAKSVRTLLNQLDDHSIEVEDFSVHTPDLDDVFLALTGHASTEENAR